VLVGDGRIKTREDYAEIFRLPSPADSDFAANARAFVEHKDEYCACACIRLGIGATIMSMGLEAFSYAMADDPGLITEIHSSYADWTAEVVPLLEDVGFDVVWAFDDVAFNSGPIFSPEFYAAHILPKERAVASGFSLPLITHSDGDMTPLLESWLELGQCAIHPLQTDVMDIYEIKRSLGDRVCLVGNIFMDDLVARDPAYIREEVHRRRERLGPGGYILSSSNSLTDNMQPENIVAIRDALAE
jgi:uroporphyrinogen decarboxylase